jgi:drug/metabolite transporter (DMT)-like permease
MSWFFLTLIAPFLYALTNHIDKVLLERYFKVSGVGSLMLYSSLLSALALPFIFWMDPHVFEIGLLNIVVLVVVGTLNILVLLCYLLALRDDEASIVIVFYQLVPVFAYALGYIILDESLTTLQLIAMAIIILGTTIISFEIDVDNKFTLRKQTIGLMLIASFCWAFGSVIFKAVALEENVWRSLFWEHTVLTFIGVGIFIFMRKTRRQFLRTFKTNSTGIISLNVLNEVIYMIGNVVFAFAYLLAPISLILLTNSFQPIFVLAIGIILTIFFPRITVEKIKAKHLWQKSLAIAITGAGTYLLLISS